MKKEIIKNALINAGLAASYIMLVAVLVLGPKSLLNRIGNEEDTILSPIIFLLLLVISVAVMAVTIFGRPVMWYLDEKKKEAVNLLGYTIGILVFIFAFFISIAIL